MPESAILYWLFTPRRPSGNVSKNVRNELSRAKEAETAMNTINRSIVKFVTLFPQGSETGGDTAAKPEIWTSKAEFDAIAKQLDAATAKAAAAAPGGLDGFKAAMADVGKSCKACHEKFRAEKK
jgi:cytochrome c556